MHGEMRAVDQLAEPAEIEVRGQQQIDDAARREALARLIEQRRDVAVARPRMPGAVGEIARLAGKRRRARDDDVEQRACRETRHQVRADAAHAIAKAVVARIARGGVCRVGIDVDRRHHVGAGARGGEREDAAAAADLCDAFAREMELADEVREILAGENYAWVEHGRWDG